MENKIHQEINKIFDKLNWPKINFHVVKPTNIEFGEYTSNVALSASKTLSTKPQEIAQKIIDNFDNKKFNIKEIKIMGPGFINFYFDNNYYSSIVKEIFQNSEFGKQPKNNKVINN